MKLEVKGDFAGQVAGHNVVHGDLIHIAALHVHVTSEDAARLLGTRCCRHGPGGAVIYERHETTVFQTG